MVVEELRMSMFPLHPDELTSEELDDIQSMLRDVEAPGDKLTDWEQEFCASIADKIEQYGERTHLSERQMEIVDRIQRKLSDL